MSLFWLLSALLEDGEPELDDEDVDELLGLGKEGEEGCDDEVPGIEGNEDEDEEEDDELGNDGEELDEDDDEGLGKEGDDGDDELDGDELGMDGIELLELLELDVVSQPATSKPSADAATSVLSVRCLKVLMLQSSSDALVQTRTSGALSYWRCGNCTQIPHPRLTRGAG